MAGNITAAQLRGARAMLHLEQRQLAEMAGISIPTLKRLEAGAGELTGHFQTIAGLIRALESVGVIFVEENGEGPGVRLKKGAGAAVSAPTAGAVEAGDAAAREMADHQVSKALKGVDASPGEKAARRDRLTKPPQRQEPPAGKGKRHATKERDFVAQEEAAKAAHDVVHPNPEWKGPEGDEK